MSSDQSFVDYIIDQLSTFAPVTYRKMFGEYALYSGSKVVALVCDNQLFVKPTETGRAFIGKPTEAPAYPGAKNSFLIDNLDDREWLAELIRKTAKELPEPKPKKKKTKKKKHK